ncbi:MAG TPA: hypothetical protein VJ729_00130 [Nitrososphaeraceae archaeon]|nr:hypothetical protein [Nitrososphaeraceae archaeon]
MNHTTLALAIVVAITAAMIAGTITATTTPAFAWGKYKHKHKDNYNVKVGSTKNKCVEAADNSQHVAFGAGSIADAAVNLPVNVQAQICNAGSTGAG